MDVVVHLVVRVTWVKGAVSVTVGVVAACAGSNDFGVGSVLLFPAYRFTHVDVTVALRWDCVLAFGSVVAELVFG